MQIVDLERDSPHVQQAAALLVAEFADHTASWPDLASALEEVEESLVAERISRVSLDADGAVLGWISAQPQYDGLVWELHPLVVRGAAQGQGIGRALVADLEAQVAARGGLTLWLGTDDEDGRTSLGGIEVYPDPLAHLAALRNPGRHPFGFYLNVGFAVVGLLPDANGWGKPDIFMAKRVGTRTPQA